MHALVPDARDEDGSGRIDHGWLRLTAEGRGTGQPGYQKAAQYVAARFKDMGLEPGGEGGGFFQSVPLRSTALAPSGISVILSRGQRTSTLVYQQDFVAEGSPRETDIAISAPLVFVGFGVTAPEFQYDDYAGIDVKGKVAVVLRGAPPAFPPNPLAHYSGSEKAKTAERNGAVGIITLWSEDAEKVMPWVVVQRLERRPQMTWLDAAGGEPGDEPKILSSLTLSAQTSASLFDGSGTTWAAVLEAARKSQPQSRALPVSVKIQKSSRITEVAAPNVIGRIVGSDPALRNQYVVITAHLDHDGIGEPMEGDSIYNGALDNAAGVAALLEIARAFTAARPAPKRSILFVATAAEELGLLGAFYYAAHPTVPIDSIVANLNMDGNLLLIPTRSIIALGAEHSNLGEVARRAAEASSLELETELMPQQAFFIRSDQYPFVLKGVPALFFINGTRSSDSTVNGAAVLGQWMTTRYHTPKDDLNQNLNYQSGARYAQAVFRVAEIVANQVERPAWKPGDFFGDKFGRSKTR
jgi:hypothetical protein